MAGAEGRDGSAHSGAHAGAWDQNRASPVVLRLLPYVEHPPCRVLVPGAGAGHEAAALNARGYVVTALEGLHPERVFPADPRDFLSADCGEPFDMLCERGLFATLPPSRREAYVAAAARALRPGGRLFGFFLDFDPDGAGVPPPPYGVSANELLHRFGAAFDVQRLEPSAFLVPGLGVPQLEAVFVRR